MRAFKKVTRLIFAILLTAAGINHFVDPAFYVSIVPPYLPWPKIMVVVSGLAEIILGIALAIPVLTRAAAWGVIALLIAVLPANIHMAANPELYPSIPAAALWIRLPIQGILIIWALWYTRGN